MQIFIKQYKCIRLLTSNPFIIKKGRPVPKDSMVFRYLHLNLYCSFVFALTNRFSCQLITLYINIIIASWGKVAQVVHSHEGETGLWSRGSSAISSPPGNYVTWRTRFSSAATDGNKNEMTGFPFSYPYKLTQGVKPHPHSGQDSHPPIRAKIAGKRRVERT